MNTTTTLTRIYTDAQECEKIDRVIHLITVEKIESEIIRLYNENKMPFVVISHKAEEGIEKVVIETGRSRGEVYSFWGDCNILSVYPYAVSIAVKFCQDKKIKVLTSFFAKEETEISDMFFNTP